MNERDISLKETYFTGVIASGSTAFSYIGYLNAIGKIAAGTTTLLSTLGAPAAALSGAMLGLLITVKPGSTNRLGNGLIMGASSAIVPAVVIGITEGVLRDQAGLVGNGGLEILRSMLVGLITCTAGGVAGILTGGGVELVHQLIDRCRSTPVATSTWSFWHRNSEENNSDDIDIEASYQNGH